MRRAHALLAVCCAALVIFDTRTAPVAAEKPREQSPPLASNAAPLPSQRVEKAQASAVPDARSVVAPVARPPLDVPGPGGSAKGTGSAAVALTFDDGPDPVNTPLLLDMLARHGVKATFCLVGHRARDHPEIVARIAEEGHTLCNHTWQHLDLSGLDEARIDRDLRATTAAIERAAPGHPVRYFRAPFGNFTARTAAVATRLGMTQIHWDVDDESFRTAEFGTGPAMVDHLVRTVRANLRHGSIVLGHDLGKPFTVTAYDQLLTWLAGRYELVPLPA
jgi:peptidoglycan/xylan/chitin deacetylase (PgdA/CDA1 family)